jgi:hypothetical protein
MFQPGFHVGWCLFPLRWNRSFPLAVEPGQNSANVEGTIMRTILAALLIAAFALPAHAVAPLRSAAKGTATVAKGAAKGTATVAKGAAKGTATVAKGAAKGTTTVAKGAANGVAHGARCVATLFHRC